MSNRKPLTLVELSKSVSCDITASVFLSADNALDAALGAAQSQIEAMTGDWETPVRLRLLDQRFGIAPEKRRAPIQLLGSLADDAFCDKLWTLNSDGYDFYVLAQGVSPRLAASAAVAQKDVEEARLVFADADDHDTIAEFHIAPTAILRRENSLRHFWLLWRTQDIPVGKIRETQQRIAQRYGTDPTVCDPARIIRLAGFTSHKREQKTRYAFEAGTGQPARYADHVALLPKLERAPIKKSDGGEDYISETRLRLALASIDPACGEPGEACRNKWIATLGAIMDAKIGRDDKTYMDYGDKFALADEWSSGLLGGSEMPANYRGSDDISATMEHLSRAGDRQRAGIGSIIQLAKALGMDAGQHEQLRKAEPFTQPGRLKPELHLAANSVPTAWPGGLYAFPDYAGRPEPKWLIPGVLQEASYSVASGRSQVGKSFCELALALSVATGKPWLGQTPTTVGPVLYVAAEGQGRIGRDARAWCAEYGIAPESLRAKFFIADHGMRLNTADGQASIEEALTAIKSIVGRFPTYLVFDTLRRNMRGSVSDGDPTSDVLHLVSELQLQKIAVTLIAHHGRSHGETKGLTEWEDDADQVRHYTGTVREGNTVVEFAKAKAADDGWSLAVDYKTPTLPDGSTTKVAVGGRRRDQVATAIAARVKKQTNPAGANQFSAQDPTLMSLLDNAVCEELLINRMKVWSTRGLAEAVAMRPAIRVPSGTLRRRSLVALREDISTRAHGCYDAHTGRWNGRSLC